VSDLDNLRALREPFEADAIEWRLQKAGEKNGKVWALVVPYVTNRGIMTRLDDVVGPANWKNDFRAGPAGGVLCGISIRVGDEWVTKWDGAENTDIEEVKGGLSGAMKRAAVQWGIGRYLYELDEFFAQVSDSGKLHGKTKDNKPFKWNPPTLPEWALPKKAPQPATEQHARIIECIRRDVQRIPVGMAWTVGSTDTHDLRGFLLDPPTMQAIERHPHCARMAARALDDAIAELDKMERQRARQGAKKVDEDGLRRFWAVAKEAGYSTDGARAMLADKFGLGSGRDLTTAHFQEALTYASDAKLARTYNDQRGAA
jgi:hypothetical protein